ncbi:MAG: hypothetical protein AB1Z98_02175 [Nannocystaceae bacterium]
MGDNGNESDESTGEVRLASIALRQIRVSQADLQDKARHNPMNRLVPYLDLFGRLSDDELARLAGVPTVAVGNLRRQVIQVDRALERFTDLLPRLTDGEMVRLTGASAKTIRFWRLCQPRVPVAHDRDDPWSVARAADKLGQVAAATELATGEADTVDEPLDSGAPLLRDRPDSGPVTITESPSRHPSGERPGVPSPLRTEAVRTEAGRTDSTETTWNGYRMPAAERDGGRHRRTPPVEPAASTVAAPAKAPDFARSAAAVAGNRKGHGTPPPPEVIEKHRAVSEQMAFSGAPFPGYDSEASGAHDDGIFIGLELPDPRTLAQPGRRDQD